MKAETLTSQRGPDGKWHAYYPTATKTLCGLPVESVKKGRKWPPDCGPSARIARIYQRIDSSSMPAHWLPDAVEEATA